MPRVRKKLAQQIDKTLSNLEETAPIDIIEEGEGVLDIEEGMYSKDLPGFWVALLVEWLENL